MIRLASITLAFAFLVTACKTGPAPEPEVRIKQVFIEQPVSCVPKNLGPAPEYPDTDAALAASADAAERYARLMAGRLLRAARLGEVEPVIFQCRKAAETL